MSAIEAMHIRRGKARTPAPARGPSAPPRQAVPARQAPLPLQPAGATQAPPTACQDGASYSTAASKAWKLPSWPAAVPEDLKDVGWEVSLNKRQKQQ